MEFTLKTSDLVTLLNTVKGTFGNLNFPILNGILFEVDANGTGIIRSNNGTETTQVKFQARVAAAGKVCLDGYTLTRLANTFAQGDITIQSAAVAFDATLVHPKGLVDIKGMDADQFPPLSLITSQSTFMLPAKDFATALKRVSFAKIEKPSGQNDFKLSGIGLTITNQKAVLACSDRKRVARCLFDAPGAVDINVILAPGCIDGLSAVSGNIAVYLSDHGVAFETNDTTYQGPVISTQFPDVTRFFPGVAPGTALLVRKDLVDSLERIAILGKAGKADPDAILTFDTTGLTITYRSNAGSVSEQIPMTYAGPTITTKFNTDVVLQGLERITKDNVEVLLHDAAKPVIFYPEGDRDFAFLGMAVVAVV
jgi:DNA polymerase III sliding clamp (beta) subunit (PCNA family)